MKRLAHSADCDKVFIASGGLKVSAKCSLCAAREKAEPKRPGRPYWPSTRKAGG
jgi:hypothetical protein